LFQALQSKAQAPENLMVLQLGADGEETIYFKTGQIVMIETSPALSNDFFLRLSQLSNTSSETVHATAHFDLSATGSVFNDSWKIWIWSNVARGASKDAIFKHLVESGFSWTQAREELSYEPAVPLEQLNEASTRLVSQQSYQENPVAQRIAHAHLQMYFIDDFLNESECDSLITAMREDLRPSSIADNETASGVESQTRTSETCSFQKEKPEHALAIEVSERLSKVIGINPNYAEPIQGQFYREGGEYKPHYDWFDPGTPSFEYQASADQGGQRTWSAIVYLNDVEAGGETRFENAQLTLKPKRGRVVFWNNLDEVGQPNQNALHQACPVLKGNKAILTLWYRSLGEGDMYIREANQLLPRYTPLGIMKDTLQGELFVELAEFYANRRPLDKRDEITPGDFLQNTSDQIPSELTDIPDGLRQKIIESLQPLCEDWSGRKLKFSALYGIRTYHRGSWLKVHTDTSSTHIISVILNVAQKVDTDWELEIHDHFERRHQLTLVPGEVLLYEGARLKHGRPKPLDGDFYANVFLHFRPQ
jgi:prolyl 4-hydroxylase